MDAADAAAPNHEGGKPVIRSDVLQILVHKNGEVRTLGTMTQDVPRRTRGGSCNQVSGDMICGRIDSSPQVGYRHGQKDVQKFISSRGLLTLVDTTALDFDWTEQSILGEPEVWIPWSESGGEGVMDGIVPNPIPVTSLQLRV